MTKSERIQAWVATHSTPNQNLCPELLQYWQNSKRKVVYWSSKTGLRTETDYDSTYKFYRNHIGNSNIGNNKWSVKPSYDAVYVDADGDMLEIAHITLQGKRGKNGEKKEWSYDKHAHFFIFANDPTAYTTYGTQLTHNQKKYVNECIKSWLAFAEKQVWDHTYIDVLKKFVAENYNVSVEGDYPWNYVDFYAKYWVSRKKSNKTKELESYELSPLAENEYAKVEILDDDYAVIRLGYSNSDSSYNANDMEKLRVFVSSQGKVRIMANNSYWHRGRSSNQWHSTPGYSYYSFGGTVITKEMYETWKPLKWISSCIDWNPNSYYGNRGNASKVITQTIDLLRHPIVESLYKAGYCEVAKEIVRNGKIPSAIGNMFGVKEKKGNLYHVLGVNKYLLKKFDDFCNDNHYYYRSSSIIGGMKAFFDNVPSMSNETIDILFDGFKLFYDRGSWWKYTLFNLPVNSDIKSALSHKSTEEVEELRRKMMWLCKKEHKHQGFIQMFMDAKQMIDRLHETPDIDLWSVDNMDELIRVHDRLIELQNYEKVHLDEIRQKAFAKKNEKRIKQYEVLDDDEYFIRVPRELAEIVTEGHVLSHCVGGYTNRVADGYTDILFLRKKSAPHTPFYTIEINQGKLIQIHGFGNRWLGNNPEAIPFVYEWLNKVGVDFDNSILLNLAVGYGKSYQQLSDDYLNRKVA